MAKRQEFSAPAFGRIMEKIHLAERLAFWKASSLTCFFLCMAFIYSALTASPAHAVLKIELSKGNVDPLPIAIVNVSGPGEKEQLLGEDITRVITNNLSSTALFRPLDPRSFIEKNMTIESTPRFGDWRIIEAQGLVTVNAKINSGGRLEVSFRLWDIFAEQQIVGFQFASTPDNWRRIGHLVSDSIYQRLTGETGYFDTRIVYIAESGPKGRRIKRLAIMDQDGANPSFLTDGKTLVLTPRFSPTEQMIVYMSYTEEVPKVYLYNLTTGQKELVGNFPGMSFAPRFSNDGTRIIMSYEKGGNSDIFVMDLRTGQTTRLTDNPAIDTSPCYSPDGTRITFNSDRGGSSQLYVMNASGTDVHRISFGQGKYNTPVWSPRGDLIAFTKQYQGRFYIGVMKPDGSGERILTSGYHAEGPTWAPNGRVLMFFKESPSIDSTGRGYGTRLWSVDLTGYNERPVISTGDGSDPAWSPLLNE